MRAIPHVSRVLAAAFVLAASTAFAADGDTWTVSRFSGEVWLAGSDVQQASLKQEDVLKPGDTVRTGRNGRVLLKRGEEMIMLAPNSVVGIPAQKKEGLSTTIVQQAGTILLDVEKRNVKHFEVETPYLAAVVKGTQFRVTVNAGKTTVDVIRGQVEVSDFKSGQIAQVMAGQHATAFANGKPGLSLGGAGTLSPIEHGKPRAPSIERVPVPRNGLAAPRHAASGQNISSGRNAVAHSQGHQGHGVTRIASSIGEVRLNVHRVTNGLAHNRSAAHGEGRSAARTETIWSSSEGSAANNSQGNSANGAANAAGPSSVSAAVAASSGSEGGAKGNGNGNNGNGNGNGGGNGNGNGNANGHGNGNGNGNGNANGHGNGNGRGRGRS